VAEADVQVRILLEGADQYVIDIHKVGQATEQAATQAGESSKKAAGGIGKWVKALATAGIVYKTYGYLKDAVSSTISLAVGTSRLQSVTNLDTKTASAWITLAKSRHISAQILQRSFIQLGAAVTRSTAAHAKARAKAADLTLQLKALNAQPVQGAKDALKHATAVGKLSEKIAKARIVTDTSSAAFKTLGLTQKQLTTGSSEGVLLRVVEGLKKIRDPSIRAAAGQKLLGRSFVALAPLLAKGSKGVEEALGHVKRFGPVLDDAGKKRALAARDGFRDLNEQSEKLKTTIGLTLIPTLSSLAKELGKILTAAQPLFNLMSKYPGVTAAVAGGIAALVLSFKIAGSAVELFQLELSAGPLGLIIFAIAALVIGLVIAYKKVGWFRNAVNDAWNIIKLVYGWISQIWSNNASRMLTQPFDWMIREAKAAFDWVKQNWPLLVEVLGGPLGLAIVQIIQHFGALKSAAHDVWNVIQDVAHAIIGAFGWIMNAIQPLIDALKTAVGWVKTAVNAVSQSGPAVTGQAGIYSSVTKRSARSGGAGMFAHHQYGGFVRGGGPVLVGEQGPELVSLPVGSQVHQAGRGGGMTVHTHVYLDRRQIAEAVGQAVADRKARR